MKRGLLILLLCLAAVTAVGQVELVPAEHRVYEFLRRMDAKGVIDFNSAVVPVSRREVALQLLIMNAQLSIKSSEEVTKLQSEGVTKLQSEGVRLSRNDRMLLEDFCKEFEYEMKSSNGVTKLQGDGVTKIQSYGVTRLQSDEVRKRGKDDGIMNYEFGMMNGRERGKDDGIMNYEFGMMNGRERGIEEKRDWVNENFNLDSRQEHSRMTGRDFINDNKYILSFNDSNVAVWGHLTGGIYFDNGSGDSVGTRKFLSGDLGFEVRGTMFDRVGFAMSYSNGRVFSGNGGDKIFANTYDAFFRTATSLKDDGKFFDHLKGYIRYEVPKRWLSIMVGKESVKQGFGFVDNLFFSGIEPYPMIKLDLKYKSVAYTFSYGNIVGDSAGIVDLPNKMVSTHRLDLKLAKWLRTGFYESVITSNTAFSFVHFNPMSFITSADLNTGGMETYKSNSLIGFDAEVKPFRNVVLQASLLVDDFNFSTITKNDSTANDNKFGYQTGIMWNDAFTVPGLSAAVEYTRLDPFVYSHRDNKQLYTHWGYSMGHQLPPNSDEIALKLSYCVLPRMYISALAQFQRSGEGFVYDSLGNMVINYGGNIYYGAMDMYGKKNVFLQGNRVNRSLLTLEASWEPVRQWTLEVKYLYKMEDLIYAGKKTRDGFLYLKIGIRI